MRPARSWTVGAIPGHTDRQRRQPRITKEEGKMHHIGRLGGLLTLLSSLFVSVLLLFPDRAWAGGGKPATKLVCVADTRSLTGFSRWVADIYNTDYWLFGLLTVVVMASMGLVLGLAFDWLMSRTGLKLGKLEHHE
jgi:ABC-type Fe3+ transport system permease subunit